ncbi:MAG: hypothetical protein ACK5TH_09150 [Prosthecobacter sp.]
MNRVLLGLLLAASSALAVPANDSFASRTVLTGSTFSISGDNTDATLESGEPNYGNIAGSSVWYEWTAAASGFVTLTADTLTGDTVLGVFTGTAVNALTQIGFNDDTYELIPGSSDHLSAFTFYAVAGTSYKISVAGYDDAITIYQQAFTLSLAPSSSAFIVSSVSLTPDPVNVTNAAASMTLTVNASSTVPGPVLMTVQLQSPTDTTRRIDLTLSEAHRSAGTAASGSYQTTFTLPRYIPDGAWKLVLLASNGLRDTRWTFGGDAETDDFVITTDPVLTVTNTGLIDTTAPALTGLEAPVTTVNAGLFTEALRVLTFQLTLTDNLSGFSSGSLSLVGTNLETTVATFTTAELSTGDALDGTYDVSAIIPYGLPAGTYDVRVRLKDSALLNATHSAVAGSGDAPLPVVADGQITITGTDGYPAWAFSQIFTTGQADLMQDDDADGSSNLLEYAFNTQPGSPDAQPLTASTGTVGLPLITRVGTVLRIEFLRRKTTTNSGLTYEPQFNDTLTNPWSPSTATPTIIDIDSTWERVLIEDDQPAATKRFARVKVSYSAP